MNLEVEEQRFGRNKDIVVNHSYISSGAYRKKFDKIGNNAELSRILYQLAKEMLFHRSGCKYEDMYWIDLDTLEIFAKETDGILEKQIVYSSATERAIKEHENILTIHSHPDSFPPSAEDFVSNYERDYRIGIVVCHNGRVYQYSADECLNKNYHKLVVERFVKQGYNEDEAQILALKRISENFSIFFKEVTSDDK